MSDEAPLKKEMVNVQFCGQESPRRGNSSLIGNVSEKVYKQIVDSHWLCNEVSCRRYRTSTRDIGVKYEEPFLSTEEYGKISGDKSK